MSCLFLLFEFFWFCFGLLPPHSLQLYTIGNFSVSGVIQLDVSECQVLLYDDLKL